MGILTQVTSTDKNLQKVFSSQNFHTLNSLHMVHLYVYIYTESYKLGLNKYI